MVASGLLRAAAGLGDVHATSKARARRCSSPSRRASWSPPSKVGQSPGRSSASSRRAPGCGHRRRRAGPWTSGRRGAGSHSTRTTSGVSAGGGGPRNGCGLAWRRRRGSNRSRGLREGVESKRGRSAKRSAATHSSGCQEQPLLPSRHSIRLRTTGDLHSQMPSAWRLKEKNVPTAQ